MEKKDLIKKIKSVVIGSGGMLMQDVETEIGDLYSLVYNEFCDSVEADVVVGEGEGIENPTTASVDIEYLSQKTLEKILRAIMED